MKTLKNLTTKEKEAIYLDWVNNFISTPYMADYYGYDEKELVSLIDEVRNMPRKKRIEFKKVNRDINGNPRYVCHYEDLLSDEERELYPLNVSPIFKVNDNLDARYALALKKSRQLGGKKFHNKQYGGGIVFQSHNKEELERQILELTK